MARRPHRALRAGVDENVGVRARGGGNIVHIREGKSGAAESAGSMGLGDHGDELAVLRRSHLDLARGTGSIARGQVFVDPIQEDLDRLAGLLGQLSGDLSPLIGAEFRAEAAPHVIRQHSDIGGRDIEFPSQLVGGHLDGLSAGPDRQLIGSIPAGRQAMGFKANVGDDRHRIACPR